MGLAPGVVIRPIQVKIPKMGLPLELIAGKMQQMQGIKDAFDEMSEMTPTALKLGKGDEELAQKYNQYVNKLSESVANAFMSGNADKAMKTLVAAKSQLAREWKEGGVATALKDRSVAYQQQLQEYNKREVGKDYTDIHKVVDFYEWKNSIGDIKYDIETGSYNSIGAIGKTTALNILEEAKKYADSLGIDKTAFVQELTNRTGTAKYGIGLNQQEKVAFNKIQQQVDTFLNDPLVSRELVVQQKYRNIQSGRADDPNKLIADASEIIDLKKKNYSKIAKEYEDFLNKPLKEKRLRYSSSELNLPSGVDEFTLSVEEQEYEDKIRKEVQKYKDVVTEIDNTKIDAKIAFNVLLDQETVQPARQLFLNQFGIKDNVTNVQWFEETDDKDKLNKLAENIKNITITPEEATEQNYNAIESSQELNNTYSDVITNTTKELQSVESIYKSDNKTYPVGNFVLDMPDGVKGLASDKQLTSTEERNDLIARQQIALSNLTEAVNIAKNPNTTEEQKINQLRDTYNLTSDNAKALYDDLITNQNSYIPIINRYITTSENLNQANSVVSDIITQSKDSIKEDIISGNNKLYKYNDKDKTLELPNTYKVKNVENVEQLVDDLFYAYDLVSKGIDISKSKDPIIKRLNENVYKKEVGYLPSFGGVTTYSKGEIKVNIQNSTIKSLMENSKEIFEKKLTRPNYGYILSKGTEKITAGINSEYDTFKDAISNIKALTDFKSKTLDKFTVVDNKGNETLVDKAGMVLDSNPNIIIGVDDFGESYITFNVKKEDNIYNVKAKFPELQKPLLADKLIEEIQYTSAQTKLVGDTYSYNNLTYLLHHIAKLKKEELGNSITISKVLDDKIQSAKALPTKQFHSSSKGIALNDVKAIPIIHSKPTSIKSGDTFIDGNLTLYKSFSGDYPYYIIGFKSQDKEYMLPVLDNKLNNVENTNTYDDYTTAVNQYLIYLYSNMIAD